MQSREATLRHRARPREDAVELAVVFATVVLAPFVGVVRGCSVWILLGFLVVRTRNVRRQLFDPETTDWLLAIGAVTRAELAGRYLLDLALRSSVHALAWTYLALIARELHEHFGWPSLPASLETVPGILGFQFALQVVLRGGIGIVRHVGSCTLLPQRVRGVANRASYGPWRQLAFLLDTALLALLAAPLVAALWSRAFWAVGGLALAYAVLLFVMIRSSEAVESAGNPPLSRYELFGRRTGMRRLRSPSLSAWNSLLWTGMQPSARLTLSVVAPLYVLVQVGGVVCARLGVDFGEHFLLLFAQVALGLLVLLLCALACFAAETPFRWQSRGATAEYLYTCGVDFGRQRRVELLAGALACLPVAAAAVSAIVIYGDPLSALALLPGVALLFARCIRDSLPFGRRRVEVRRVAGWIGYALVAFWLSTMALPAWSRASRLFDDVYSRPVLVAWIVAPFVLGALWLWIRAFIRSGNENGVKRELEWRRGGLPRS